MKPRIWVLAVTVGLALCGSASAKIPTDLIQSFNTALEKNDSAAILQISEELIAAATETPDDPYAREIAFEAGTQLCIREACDRARGAAPLMRGPASQEVSAELGNLLIALSEWSVGQNSKTSTALEKALSAVAPQQPTFLTIVAFDKFHAAKLKAGNLAQTQKIADLAIAHYAPVRAVIPENWATVELSSIATTFSRKRGAEALDRLARLEVSLYPYILEEQEDRPGLKDLYYQTQAWRYAITSWFRSHPSSHRRAIAAADEYVETERKKLRKAYYETRERPPRYCRGGLDKTPSPDYPHDALKEGYIGAVLIGFDLEADEIRNVRVLAAVPDSKFEKAALDSMKNVRWTYNEQQPEPDCSKANGQLVTIPFQFVMWP